MAESEEFLKILSNQYSWANREPNKILTCMFTVLGKLHSTQNWIQLGYYIFLGNGLTFKITFWWFDIRGWKVAALFQKIFV
jgi:hypothetical protein